MKWLPLTFILFFSNSALAMGQRNDGANTRNSPSWTSRLFDNVTAPDLAAARQRYHEESCFTNQGLRVSCGERTEWRNGDPSYTWDPYFSEIPARTPVTVEMRCNASTGRFEMNIKLSIQVCNRGANGQIDQSTCRREMKYMHNPYETGPSGFLSDQPTEWTMSPGLYNPSLPGNTPTDLPVATSYSDRTRIQAPALTEYHRVSSNQPWDGAPMFHAVWVRGGIAIHGSSSVDGHARSGGCIRLSMRNAEVFFRLVRRVGYANVEYDWGGYGPGNPPACATPPNIHNEVRAARQASTRADRDQAVADLEAAIQGQMAREGRVRADTPESAEGARAVQSVGDANEKTPDSPGFLNKVKNFFRNLFSGQ